jgi:hypothetical protein
MLIRLGSRKEKTSESKIRLVGAISQAVSLQLTGVCDRSSRDPNQLDKKGDYRILEYRKFIMISRLIHWGITLAILIMGGHVCAGDAVFDAPRQYPIELYYNSIVVDVNQDGLPDVVSLRYSTDSIMIALNDGNNGLLDPFSVHVRPTIFSMAMGDLNGDGWIDMACSHRDYYPEDLYIYLNDGSMSFTVADSMIGYGLVPGTIADFNGDGLADIKVFGYHDGLRVIYHGDGAGHLTTADTLPVNWSTQRFLDVDNDSDLDIYYMANGYDGGPLIVGYNNGQGDYAEVDSFEVPLGYRLPKAADINGDGWIDLVGVTRTTNYPTVQGGIDVMLNSGAGRFGDLLRTAPTHTWDDIGQILLGDLNADGYDDILASWGDGQFEVYESNGDGYFHATEEVALSNQSPTAYPRLIDFDLDGDADILISSGGVTVLENDGAPLFDLPPFFARDDYRLAELHDFDLDGYPDILGISQTDNLIVIVRNSGTGYFSGWKSYLLCVGIATDIVSPGAIRAGDVNGDGLPDLVSLCSQYGSTELQLFLSGGDDLLDPYPVYHDMGDRMQDRLKIADVNGDGRNDVITWRAYSGELTISYGDPDGLLGPPVEIPLGNDISLIAVGDIDGDAHAEIITTGDDRFNVLEHNGANELELAFDIPVSYGVRYIGLADLTGDGHPELITQQSSADAGLAVYLNDGSGGFDLSPMTNIDGYGGVAMVGHLDRNEHADLYVGRAKFNITTLSGNGDGSFNKPVGYFGVATGSGLMADLDLDGYDDLVVPSPGGFRVVWNMASDVTSTQEYLIEELLPVNYTLDQNYPNPFNPETVINYSLPRASQVRLTIHNILGQWVATLVEGVQLAGEHTVAWNGRNSQNHAVASGVYFYRLVAGDQDETRKMLLLK